MSSYTKRHHDVCARRTECVRECVTSAALSNNTLSLPFLSCKYLRALWWYSSRTSSARLLRAISYSFASRLDTGQETTETHIHTGTYNTSVIHSTTHNRIPKHHRIATLVFCSSLCHRTHTHTYIHTHKTTMSTHTARERRRHVNGVFTSTRTSSPFPKLPLALTTNHNRRRPQSQSTQ